MWYRFWCWVVVGLVVGGAAGQEPGGVQFPSVRPERGNFVRPLDGQTLDISPPGFCWWRTAKAGQVEYLLRITAQSGAVAYESPRVRDNAHVPDTVLPAGKYSWTVDCLAGDKVVGRWPPQSFIINPDAYAQPWVPAQTLLARVPREHPRLGFPAPQLESIRATLATTRKDAYADLVNQAKRYLAAQPPGEPDYHLVRDPAERRLAYVEQFGRFRREFDEPLIALALMYALSGEAQYAEAAKPFLLKVATWNPDGVSRLRGLDGDEIGLSLAKTLARAYDWLYPSFTPDEREICRQMLLNRGHQLIDLLRDRHDYLARPENSHDGRLPGYLVEHALALAEEPIAAEWLDYALRVLMTVFPHWAGHEGGWAEGMSYGLAYNSIYLGPLDSLQKVTGLDLWQRPFYRRVGYFFTYNYSNLAEVMPWGDIENSSSVDRAGTVRNLLQYHARKFRDPRLRAYIERLRDENGNPPGTNYLPGLLLPDDLKPADDAALVPDAAFRGVGWATFHSNIGDPASDVVCWFKSSPYGGVSHSHADQNSFVICAGKDALAIPAGSRYPSHGSPFHREYTQATLAHNAVLVNGQGQIYGSGRYGGEIVAFESTPHLGYTCGDATRCFGDRLTRNRRHLVFCRHGVIVVIDDLAAADPAEWHWLLHAKERLELDEAGQSLVSTRGASSLRVQLATLSGFSFRQTDEWSLDPKTGFPTVRQRVPEKQWHFTAATRRRTAALRIAAVMTVNDATAETRVEDNRVIVRTTAPAGTTTIEVSLDPAVEEVVTTVFTGRDGKPVRMVGR